MPILIILFTLLVGGALPGQSNAHTIRPAVATVEVADSGVTKLSVRLNLEAVVAGVGWQHADTSESPNAAAYDRLRQASPDELAQKFAELLPQFLAHPLLQVDGDPVELRFDGVDIPPVGDVDLARDSTIRLSARLPEAAQAIVWGWPVDYGSSVVRIFSGGSDSAFSEWLQPGETSAAFQLGDDRTATEVSTVVANYLTIGFEHILPKGLDHILFVVGIFLLSLRLKPLLLQVTAFTVAHTITLGLSIYGIISLPASIVEPLIALSIAYVGIENCLSSKLQPWRLALVFAFGLLHGLGFAGVLSEIGLPRADYLTALIAFNVGVEFGQLAVILCCFLLVGWWRNKSWYRPYVVVPCSLLIAVTGLYWTWERIFA